MTLVQAPFRLILLMVLLLALACAGPADTGAAEEDDAAPATETAGAGSDEALASRTQWQLADFTVHVPSPPAEAKQTCTEPKPPDIGCNQICKPCITFRCVDGEWVSDDVDFGVLCQPAPGGVKIEVCERFGRPSGLETDTGASAGGFCPAECGICT